MAQSKALSNVFKLRPIISVKDPAYGAKGDFDPTTGAGTDDRVAIQAALDAAKALSGGARVVFPAGNYYLGTGYTDSASGMWAQLLLGSRTVANDANNIEIVGEGASIFAGAAGRSLYLANANNIDIHGLKFRGYVGGALGAGREFDTAIYVGFSARDVNIHHNYITNYLGWSIGAGGDTTVAGGDTGKAAVNCHIFGNTIKGRYGDGVVASSGGSMSQQCVQFIDVQGAKVRGNIFIGRVKFEPNLNGQYMADIDVGGNTFLSGWVTPIVPAATADYWADEALGKYDGAGSEIVQALSLDGVAGAPKVSNACFHDNTFENGTITGNTEPYVVDILRNRFQKGKILIGSHAVNARRFSCSGNVSRTVNDVATAFIVILGAMSISEFKENTLLSGDFPCIKDDGTGTDNGTNVYNGNVSIESTTGAVLVTRGNSVVTEESLSGAPSTTTPKTWVTTLTDGANTATLSRSTGYYVQTGRRIDFMVRFTVSALNSLGAGAYITLPFTANAASQCRATPNILPVAGYTPTATAMHLAGQIVENTNKMTMHEVTAAGGFTTLAGTTNIGATFDCIVSGSYFI